MPAFTDIHAPELLYDFRPGFQDSVMPDTDKALMAELKMLWQDGRLVFCGTSEKYRNHYTFHELMDAMPDTDKALRRHMHQEPEDKLHPGNRKCFPASAIFIVLDRKGDRFLPVTKRNGSPIAKKHSTGHSRSSPTLGNTPIGSQSATTGSYVWMKKRSPFLKRKSGLNFTIN